MAEINFQHIAFQIGNDLKYSIAVKDIDRVGSPNPSKRGELEILKLKLIFESNFCN